MTTVVNDNISSSEMTAYWRSNFPAISNDSVSAKLASNEGVLKAHLFEEKYEYSLVARKISTRAGWCLKEVVNLLLTKQYDACISLGSGFSLLTYNAAILSELMNVQFVDVDVPEIIASRNSRINSLKINGILDATILAQFTTMAINLESAYQSGAKFHELFPSCQHPIFILEGIIYFLSKECLSWIFTGIASYKKSSVIFDYWPDDILHKSLCARKMLASLDEFIPEQIQGLLSAAELNKLCQTQMIKDISLQEVENQYSLDNNEQAQLVDLDQFIPVRLRVAIFT